MMLSYLLVQLGQLPAAHARPTALSSLSSLSPLSHTHPLCPLSPLCPLCPLCPLSQLRDLTECAPYAVGRLIEDDSMTGTSDGLQSLPTPRTLDWHETHEGKGGTGEPANRQSGGHG
jgi:hypothetical protein